MATPPAVWSEKIGNTRLRYHANGSYSVQPRTAEADGRRLSPRWKNWGRSGPCQKCKGKKFCPICDAQAYAGTLEMGANHAAGRGFVTALEAQQATAVEAGPTIEEGLRYYINLEVACRTPGHLATYRCYAAMFVRWLKEFRPGVRTWDQVNRDLIQEYLNAGVAGWPGTAKGKPKTYSPITIKGRLNPIHFVWERVAERYAEQIRPIRWRALRLPSADASAGREDKAWTAEELVTLVRAFQDTAPALAPTFAVMAFTGARMKEAVYIRLRDINLKALTITITGTPWHSKLKTPSSYRELPVGEVLAGILAAQVERRKEQGAEPDHPLVLSDRSGEAYTAAGMTSAFRAALREIAVRHAADHPQAPNLARIPARHARASFATMARRTGVPLDRIAAYMGHVGADKGTQMLERHYLQTTVADLKRDVTDPVGALISVLWTPQPSEAADEIAA